MNNNPEKASPNIDERLADFVDRALAAPQHVGQDAPDTPLDVSEDEELLELERTVLRMKQAFPFTPAQTALQTRLRLRLASEWRKQPVPQAKAGWLQRLGLPTRPAARWTLAFAVASLLLAFVAFLNPGRSASGGPLFGAAGGAVAPILGLVALVSVLITIWLLRDKE